MTPIRRQSDRNERPTTRDLSRVTVSTMPRTSPRHAAQFLRNPILAVALGAALLPFGCLRELYPPGLLSDSSSDVVAGASAFKGTTAGTAFTGKLIQARTFVDGSSVSTVTYQTGDLTRAKLGIDFNHDGKVDPIVAYGGDQGVVQILLSSGGPGTVDYVSLTLDSKLDMKNLSDVAASDIDGDGTLDIVASGEGAIWYLHHPVGEDTTVLRDWTVTKIDASEFLLSKDETQAIIDSAIGPGTNLDNYLITVEQLYRNVEIADFDNDGDNDVAGSRSFKITLSPLPGLPLQPIQIQAGDVLIFTNPGNAVNGLGWGATSIGVHERPGAGLDRDGASGLLVYDMDGDGDLDVISSARDDNNVQVAWFENPGGELSTDNPWTQWRIGSVRDAWSIDIGDLTGDGKIDVVATGGKQMQLMLFEQPAEGPKRDYDWDTFPIVTFLSYEPRDVKVLDINSDGIPELVIGGTQGAVRYFSKPADPHSAWNAVTITTYDPPGEVGLIGYGELDGDGDIDLVTVVKADQDNDSQIGWIRNDTINVLGALATLGN